MSETCDEQRDASFAPNSNLVVIVVVSTITHLLVVLVDRERAEQQAPRQTRTDEIPISTKGFASPHQSIRRENEEGLLLFVRQHGEEMSWGGEIEGQRIMNDNELLGENPRHSQRNVVWQCEAKFRRQLLVESSPLQELERP